MNWKRGFLRLWLLFAVLWVVADVVFILSVHRKLTEAAKMPAGLHQVTLQDYVDRAVGIAALTVPLIVLAIGWAVGWAGKGFRKDE